MHLTFRWPCNVINSYNKAKLDALSSQIYFWNKILRVSHCFSIHHQEFFTVHTAMVYVIQFCWQLASRIRTELAPSWSYSQAVSKAVWHIPLLCVQWKSPDDGRRNSAKRVDFCSKKKFENLVHQVALITYKNFWCLKTYQKEVHSLTYVEFILGLNGSYRPSFSETNMLGLVFLKRHVYVYVRVWHIQHVTVSGGSGHHR